MLGYTSVTSQIYTVYIPALCLSEIYLSLKCFHEEVEPEPEKANRAGEADKGSCHAFNTPVVLGSNLTCFQKVSISEIWVSFNQIYKRNNGSLQHSSHVLFNFIAF